MALARKPFVVLDAEILSSSVWAEAAHVRLVWITMLILCDTEGYVGASLPGIARASGVTLEQAEDALARLSAPDKHSRTQTHEGRRIETVPRGYLVLNFLETLDRLSDAKAKARERVRRHRERKAKREETLALPPVTFLSAQGIGNRDQGPANKLTTTDTPPAPDGASSPKGDHSAVVLRIFDHWKTTLSPKAKLSPKRKRLILARLGDGYTEEDLLRAIDGCAASPFNMGENSTGTRYVELTLILRDPEHVDQYLTRAPERATVQGARPSWEVLGITEEEWQKQHDALMAKRAQP